METAVLDEVKKFTDLIDKRLEDSESNSTTSSDLNIELGIAVVNSLWSILTGEQIDHGDRRVSDVILGTGKFIRRESMLGALMVYPWLRHLPIFNKQFSHSKNVGPLKMRQLQDDMVAMKKVHDFLVLQYTRLQKLSKCEVRALLCSNLIILPPLQFYVKSNIGKFKLSKNAIFGNFRGSQI